MYQKIPAFLGLNGICLQELIEDKLRNIVTLADSETLSEIRLSQCKNYTTVTYRSAIALSLASKTGLKSVEIAHNLVTELTKLPGKKSPNLDITISVLPSGIIEFMIENIDIYLDILAKNIFKNQVKNTSKNIKNNETFLIKLTLNRCYSLLNLGQEQQLIKLKNIEYNSVNLCWLKPEKIHYSLLFKNEEKKLISEIITVIDNWKDEKKALKLAIKLSEIFWDFERYCRIFGSVKQEKLPLAQARLGLVYLTYLLLQQLSELI